MKIAILYICTGKYECFFEGFYNSMEKYFLDGIADKFYFVWTDSEEILKTTNTNVKAIRRECQGFPKDSLFRFSLFKTVEEDLRQFDYVYFFNSNAEIKQSVGEDILPDDTGLVAAEWPGRWMPFKHPMFYPYERNKKSTAYIPHNKGTYIYYMGGINGGKSNEYIKMIDTLASNIDDDYECGIVAIVHDESHINKYLSDHSCKVLKPQYCWPEEWGTVISPLIVFRDKSAFGKYFDISKGRKHPFLRKAKKFVRVMANAVRWYL